MLKQLYLIRHAHATPADLSMKDFDRPLSASGLRDATHLGMFLSDQAIVPDAILCSPSLRTRETVEAIANQIKFEEQRINFVDDLYEPSVRQMLSVINELDDTENIVFIISHNPAITYLGEYLTGAAIGNMSPASMVTISFDIATWGEVSQGTGTFEKHILADQI